MPGTIIEALDLLDALAQVGAVHGQAPAAPRSARGAFPHLWSIQERNRVPSASLQTDFDLGFDFDF